MSLKFCKITRIGEENCPGHNVIDDGINNPIKNKTNWKMANEMRYATLFLGCAMALLGLAPLGFPPSFTHKCVQTPSGVGGIACTVVVVASNGQVAGTTHLPYTCPNATKQTWMGCSVEEFTNKEMGLKWNTLTFTPHTTDPHLVLCIFIISGFLVAASLCGMFDDVGGISAITTTSSSSSSSIEHHHRGGPVTRSRTRGRRGGISS